MKLCYIKKEEQYLKKFDPINPMFVAQPSIASIYSRTTAKWMVKKLKKVCKCRILVLKEVADAD